MGDIHMYENLKGILKNQPDWIEVPVKSGMEEAFRCALSEIGVTPDEAIDTFVNRVIDFVKLGKPIPPVSQIADLAIVDMMTQLLIEPTEHFYHIELPDYACPAFITWSHDLFGTKEDINAFFGALTEEQRKSLGEKNLTAVPILGTRSAISYDYKVTHMNIHGFPYYISSPKVESVHVWLKYNDRYYRCIRARLTDMHYTSDDDIPPMPIHTPFFGFPHIIENNRPYTFSRLYEVEKIFNTWAETEKDLKSFTCEIDLTNFFNDIFGDG